jgi:hypothetical protein
MESVRGADAKVEIISSYHHSSYARLFTVLPSRFRSRLDFASLFGAEMQLRPPASEAIARPMSHGRLPVPKVCAED